MSDETETTSGPSNGACLDCYRRYGDEHGFPDLIVPDRVWEAINPGMGDAGLLCPSCICARAHRAGIRSTAYFASGPFEQDAQIAAPVPAEQPATGSVGRGGSGGSCARCGAGTTLPADDPENYEMAVCMSCEIAVLKEGWQMARAQVEAIRAAITREAAHGDAITRCNLVAERFQTVLDSVTKPETNENEEA